MGELIIQPDIFPRKWGSKVHKLPPILLYKGVYWLASLVVGLNAEESHLIAPSHHSPM